MNSGTEDRTLGRSPARQFTSELDTDVLRSLQFPWQVGHNIDGISTTDTNSNHTKTSLTKLLDAIAVQGGYQTYGIRSVRIGTNHKTTGEGVVLKNDLVNDTRTRSPETDVVLGAGR